MSAPIPVDEEVRLRALRSLNILDTLPEQAFDDVTFLASCICETPIALISLVDRERQWFKSRVGLEAQQTPRESAFCAHAILRPHALMEVEDATQDQRFVANPLVVAAPDIRFYAGAPLVNPDGQALGTLCVIDDIPRQLDDRQRRALTALSRQVMAQFSLRSRIAEQDSERSLIQRYQRQLEIYQRELETDNATLARRSEVDGLTNLLNRGAFDERLCAQFRLSPDAARPLSLLMLDIDRFKQLNDTHGHVAGDAVLREVAAALSGCTREGDLTARFGGEEFVMLLPNCTLREAHGLGERARAAIAALQGPCGPVTISVGVAQRCAADVQPEDVVRRADGALYAAKHAGRNRVASA